MEKNEEKMAAYRTSAKPADLPKACPSCVQAFNDGWIRAEAIQALTSCPSMGLDGEPQCHDCASAGTLVRFKYVPTWAMGRTAVGNDRQEQYRLPGMPMGLVKMGLVRASQPGDLEKHHEWLITALGYEGWEENDNEGFGRC